MAGARNAIFLASRFKIILPGVDNHRVAPQVSHNGLNHKETQKYIDIDIYIYIYYVYCEFKINYTVSRYIMLKQLKPMESYIYADICLLHSCIISQLTLRTMSGLIVST